MGTTLATMLLGGMAAAHPGLLHAQTGRLNTAFGGGFRVDVDTRWPDGSGYRPVRITVTPTGAQVSDRTLVFEFTTNAFYGRQDRVQVVQEIELPAGSGPVTTTVAVPHISGHWNYEFRVGEGGRQIRGLFATGNFQNNANFETAPRVLLVADQDVASSNLGRLFIDSNMNPPQKQGQYPLPTLHRAAAKDLPSRWIDYSALDMICLSHDDLQLLKTAHPDTFRAVLDWTAAGGNLLVFDVGPQWERRDSLERLVDLAGTDAAANDGRDTSWQTPARNWFGKRVEGIGSAVGPYEDIGAQVQQQNWNRYGPYGQVTVVESMVETMEQPKGAQKKSRPQVPDRPPFVSRPYEMGMLVAIATDKPFDEDPGFWAWLCNHLTSHRTIWYQRHGISLQQNNPEFFKFLIEGVGKAPLNAFRILITLFVVAIGPVNYYILRRFRRLHLLIVTVPASAAGVTLALFAYAILSDGLGTRVRVRSVTQINQRTGQTECWARLSYYSGLAPGEGLRFPQDVAVYPIQAVTGDLANGNRVLGWYGEQRLESGWLRSRTPTQFLTVRSRKSQLGIDVGPRSENGLTVKNRLGTEVELLVVRDRDGKFYSLSQLADGAEMQAQLAKPEDAVDALLSRIQACQMVQPPGIDVGSYQRNYRSPYYYYAYAGDGPQPAPETSLMEGSIQDVVQRSPSSLPGLRPGSYAAIVRFSPEVELGTSVASQESSLHLVLGAW